MVDIQLYGATPEDYDDYFRIRCEPSDIYWMGHTSPPNYDYLRNIYLSRLGSNVLSKEGDKVIYFARDTKGNTIGFTMLSFNRFGVEIGISLFQHFQGRGFGTQIVSRVLVYAKAYNRIIYATIRDDNYASQAIFLRNGFERTDFFEMKSFPGVGPIGFRRYVYLF